MQLLEVQGALSVAQILDEPDTLRGNNRRLGALSLFSLSGKGEPGKKNGRTLMRHSDVSSGQRLKLLGDCPAKERMRPDWNSEAGVAP